MRVSPCAAFRAGGSLRPVGSTPASATAVRWRTKSRVEPLGSRRAQAAARSARRESPNNRSATSGWAANSRWRRRPTASIRRLTKTSARRSSITAEAVPYSLRKDWIRSRASGEICGLSSAASQAETMSSLRRLAMVVRRARSAERSSTGGRVSARAAAAESAGSARTLNHAIASRTSGRWNNAAGPDMWNGIPRSSIAAATGPLCSWSSTSTQISSGAIPPAIKCSASRATAWAWARSLLQRQNLAAGLQNRSLNSTVVMGEVSGVSDWARRPLFRPAESASGAPSAGEKPSAQSDTPGDSPSSA